MAYLALARKWRPKSFSEVVGQTHVVRALSNALNSGRVHHAYLFTGTRGVGKTTLARIFAKSLNCETGTSAEPCQQCSTCLSVDEGRFVDLIEVDAASRTKVDDTRELLENVQYAPTSGKFKVYLIDEVHMLSGHSFNALLKTLEEPPEHVKFLFATTDPQKLPVTVLSRCLQFNLRAMRPEQVENQLVKILDAEQIDFEQEALHSLAKAADGSMRDGLSLLDQAIAQSGSDQTSVISVTDVEAMLGTVRAAHSNALLGALVAQDAEQVMQVVADMAAHAVDFGSALDELLMQLYNISLAQIAPAALAAKGIEDAELKKYAEQVSPEQIQLYYQIGLLGKKDIALAPSLRVGFEVALLRMLVFEPAAASNSTGSAQASTTVPPVSQRGAQPAVSQPAVSQAEVSQAEVSQAEVSQAEPAEQSLAQPVVAKNAAAENTTAHPQPSVNAAALAGQNEWGEMIEQTQLQGFSKQLAMHCACERITDKTIELALAPKLQHLFKDERRVEIEAEMCRLHGSQLQVELTIEESNKETPAECLERLGVEKHAKAKVDLEGDPAVRALISEFDATIVEKSIKPAE